MSRKFRMARPTGGGIIVIGIISHIFRAPEVADDAQTSGHEPRFITTFASAVANATLAVPKVGEVTCCGIMQRDMKRCPSDRAVVCHRRGQGIDSAELVHRLTVLALQPAAVSPCIAGFLPWKGAASHGRKIALSAPGHRRHTGHFANLVLLYHHPDGPSAAWQHTEISACAFASCS